MSEVLFDPDKVMYEYNTGEMVVFDQHTGSYAYLKNPWWKQTKPTAIISHAEFESKHGELAHAMHDYNDTHCAECGKYRPGDERVRAGMKCGFCAYGG